MWRTKKSKSNKSDETSRKELQHSIDRRLLDNPILLQFVVSFLTTHEHATFAKSSRLFRELAWGPHAIAKTLDINLVQAMYYKIPISRTLQKALARTSIQSLHLSGMFRFFIATTNLELDKKLPNLTQLKITDNSSGLCGGYSNFPLVTTKARDGRFPKLRSLTIAARQATWDTQTVADFLVPSIEELRFEPPCRGTLFAPPFGSKPLMKELLPNLKSLSIALLRDAFDVVDVLNSKPLDPAVIFAPFPKLEKLSLEGVELEAAAAGGVRLPIIDFSAWESKNITSFSIRQSNIVQLNNLSSLPQLRYLQIDLTPAETFAREDYIAWDIARQLPHCRLLAELHLAGFKLGEVLAEWDSNINRLLWLKNESKAGPRLLFPAMRVVRFTDCRHIEHAWEIDSKAAKPTEHPIRRLCPRLQTLDLTRSAFTRLSDAALRVLRDHCVEFVAGL